MAVDFDGGGNLFVVIIQGGTIYMCELFEYSSGDPNTYISAWYTTLNSYIGGEVDVFDIAFNRTNNLIYLFDAGAANHGRVTVYSVPSGVFQASYDGLFSQPLAWQGVPNLGVAGFADIDIDHQGDKENCHIVLYASLIDDGSEIQKRDADMNLVANTFHNDKWPSMTVNPEPNVTGRDLMLPGMDKLGFWFAPSDW
jgi:hypothetical protein